MLGRRSQKERTSKNTHLWSRYDGNSLGTMDMVDKSWGVSGTPSFRVRANDTGHRAIERAAAREARSVERAGLMAQRQEERIARREADLQANEEARARRREQEEQLAATDPHTAAAQRRRGSGRRDVVREQRDTTGYAMVVDGERIRTLAARGASVASLSAVLGMSEDEVQRALAAA